MNYFFELLDSYRKRDCCVSRIDEKKKKIEEPLDPTRYATFKAKIVELITAASKAPNSIISEPKGNKTLPSRNSYRVTIQTDGNFSITIGGDTKTYTPNGDWLYTPDLKVQKSIVTKALGDGSEPAAATSSPQQQQQQQQQPEVQTPQKSEDDAQKLKESFDRQISEIAKGLVKELREKKLYSKACKALLGEFLSISQAKHNRKGYHEETIKFVDDIYNTVINEPGYRYNNPNIEAIGIGACRALNLLRKCSSEKIRSLECSGYDYGKFDKLIPKNDEVLEEAALAKKASANHKNIALKQLSRIFTIKGESLTKLLSTECEDQKRKDCLKQEKLVAKGSDADLIAAKKNLQRYLDFLSGEGDMKNPTEDQIKEIWNSIVFTRQKEVLIAGTSLASMVMVNDRNRSLYDVLASKFKLLTGKDPKIIDTSNFGVDSNKLASIRGKVDEHMPVIASLVQRYNKAKSEKNEELMKNLDDAINAYAAKTENLCTYVQAIRQFLAGFEEQEYSLKGEDLADFRFMNNDTRNTRYCNEVKDTLTLAIGFASNKVDYMKADLVMQVGDDVGDGVRQDLAYVYEDEAAANAAAARLGVSNDYVIKMPLRKLLDISPQFKEAYPEELLGDQNREVYTILEGVKIESGTDTTYGSLSVGRLLESMMTNKLNYEQQELQKRTRNALGISGRNYDMQKVGTYQREFSESFLKIDETLERIQPEYTVNSDDGKKVKERGSVVIKSMLDDLKANKQYDSLKENATISAGEALIKALDDKKSTPEIREKLKSDFIKAFKRERLFSFVSEAFKTNDSGELLDRDKAAAAADILGRTGQSHLPMITTINKLSYKVGKTKSYRIDHGEASTGCLAALLQGKATVQVNSDSSFGGIGITYKDPNGKIRKLTFHYRDGSLAATGNMKNSEASKLTQMENASISRNHPLILETLKFLTGHLKQLSKLAKV